RRARSAGGESIPGSLPSAAGCPARFRVTRAERDPEKPCRSPRWERRPTATEGDHPADWWIRPCRTLADAAKPTPEPPSPRPRCEGSISRGATASAEGKERPKLNSAGRADERHRGLPSLPPAPPKRIVPSAPRAAPGGSDGTAGPPALREGNGAGARTS